MCRIYSNQDPHGDQGKWNFCNITFINSSQNEELSSSCIALSFDRFHSISWHSVWFFQIFHNSHIYSHFQFFRLEYHCQDWISRNAHLVHQNWYRISYALKPLGRGLCWWTVSPRGSLQLSASVLLENTNMNSTVRKKVNFINSSQNDGLSPSCIALSSDGFDSISWHSVWFLLVLSQFSHLFGFPTFWTWGSLTWLD
jgi:hypothetical protein